MGNANVTGNLVDQIQKSAGLERQGDLYLPPGARTYRSWPLCMTCMKEVEAAEITDVTNWEVKLKARCHGKTQGISIRFPYRIESNDVLEDEMANECLKMALKSATMFDPTVPEK
jgi:hypothetical protein